jgi:hypothetical protein
MAEETKPLEVPKEAESWMQKKWRPMMAMMYMAVCACDFILFPIMWTIVQFWEVQAANDAFRQWQPLTLQGGGLFHMAMGAVLGITAWSRGQEKMAGASAPVAASPATPPVAIPQGFNGTTAEDIKPSAPPVAVGFNGKLAPPPAPQPLL